MSCRVHAAVKDADDTEDAIWVAAIKYDGFFDDKRPQAGRYIIAGCTQGRIVA